MKVVVVTRTKDRPLFLKRALISVQNQTFTDYQHVIVNDGGDREQLDNIINSLNDQMREKIEVFHRPESSNAPDTIFNESIDRVSSEYFALHDDDDTWHPDFLKQTVSYLDANREDGAVVVRTDKVIEELTNNTINEKKRVSYMPDMRAVSLYRQCIDNQLTPIATLFRRSAYESVGKFDDTLPVVGDWEFGIRLLQKYDVGYIATDHALANYHHRRNKDNSFADHNHRYYVTKVSNRYLRAELIEGRLGVGYIMSKLKYNQDNLHSTVKRFIPKWFIEKVK